LSDFAAAFDKEFATADLLGALPDIDESEFADEDRPAPALEPEPTELSDEFDAAMRVVGFDEATLDEVTDIVGTATQQEIDSRQIATHRPVAVPRKVTPKFRQWQVDTGPVFGPAGAETTVTIRPQARFRSEKIYATDDSSTPGKGTRILSVTVGHKVQRVGLGQGMLTQFFSAQALANGIEFDTSSPWATISIRVAFVQQCNFELSIFGTVEVDE
jgi:hypothetical protein